jgi:hypothetical protein
MGRKRRRTDKSDKEAKEESKKFLYTMLAILLIFIAGFFVLNFWYY